MNFIIVDDERLALQSLHELLRQVAPDANTECFLEPKDALIYLKKQTVDIAFLDIEIGGINGIAFAKMCKDICPYINIIFVTGYDQYAMDAIRLRASGYLMKPVRIKDLENELDHLRYPIPITPKSRIRIQTFGNFEIFVDGAPLRFPMAKCKECLAYLVDRKGAMVTTGEIGGVLWEDKPYDKIVQNNTHRVISDLIKTLEQADARNIIIKNRTEMGIDIRTVDCDYFEFLQGNVSHINAFRGEYMSNYSWAELTLSTIQINDNIK